MVRGGFFKLTDGEFGNRKEYFRIYIGYFNLNEIIKGGGLYFFVFVCKVPLKVSDFRRLYFRSPSSMAIS